MTQPENDPRLLDACLALMDVKSIPPAGDKELPVLDLDPDFHDLPRDHTQGTSDDPITQEAVVKLAKAVLAVADRYAEPNSCLRTALAELMTAAENAIGCEEIESEAIRLRALIATIKTVHTLDANITSGGMTEAVNHPEHYGGGNNAYEAIKVIEAWQLDFCLGNTVKYISRAGKKDATKEIEDLEKARWYLDRRIAQLRVATHG